MVAFDDPVVIEVSEHNEDILDYVGDNQVLRNKILKSRILGIDITLSNMNNLTDKERNFVINNYLHIRGLIGICDADMVDYITEDGGIVGKPPKQKTREIKGYHY